MKSINQQSTKVFIALLNKLADKELHEFTPPAEGFMPLTIEKMEENILTPVGVAVLYRLFHHFSEKGNTLYDPQMRFLVVDNRKGNDDTLNIAVIAQYFGQDSTGADDESIIIENGHAAAIKKTWQADQTLCAAQWLINIKRQGYLK